METITTNQLTNAQIEILKLFSKPMSAKQLSNFRQVLLDYLQKQIDDEADEVWEKKNFTKKDEDKFLKTHIKRVK